MNIVMSRGGTSGLRHGIAAGDGAGEIVLYQIFTDTDLLPDAGNAILLDSVVEPCGKSG